MKKIIRRIRDFNAGRDPERVAMKFARLRASPFAFFRGTCHLFYESLPDGGPFANAPLAWLCGDAHLENFGSYKGDNRLAYFDLNDFDEAALAPASWDVARLLCSILVAGDTLGVARDDALALCDEFIDAYAATLRSGKACWIERETARGLVRTLLDDLRTRKRPEFLDTRTTRKGRRRTLVCDGRHALPATPAQRAQVAGLLGDFTRGQPDAAFFEVLDIARRVAGTGSLDVDRFVILVRGKGSPDRNYLLDLKQAMPSEVARRLPGLQPAWASEAHRVVALQRRLQAVSMAFLHPVVKGDAAWILRGLQPSEDRIALGARAASPALVRDALRDMGHLLASAHLRGSGRQGSACADALIEFALARGKWGTRLVKAARDSAGQVRDQWTAFADAFDRGRLG